MAGTVRLQLLDSCHEYAGSLLLTDICQVRTAADCTGCISTLAAKHLKLRAVNSLPVYLYSLFINLYKCWSVEHVMCHIMCDDVLGDLKCRRLEADLWRRAKHFLHVGILRVWNAVHSHSSRTPVSLLILLIAWHKILQILYCLKYNECYFIYGVCFRAEFNFTSQYVVQVDDFFLHYLQKVSCCTLLLCITIIYQIINTY